VWRDDPAGHVGPANREWIVHRAQRGYWTCVLQPRCEGRARGSRRRHRRRGVARGIQPDEPHQCHCDERQLRTGPVSRCSGRRVRRHHGRRRAAHGAARSAGAVLMGARCMAAVIAATLLTACGSREPNDVNRPRVEPAQTLSFDGHTSATPWVAADGNLVVVAWGVTNDVGTSVALALSRDGGRTFGAPQLVPGSEGARLGGEFPPRVDTRHVEGRDEIAVTWTAGDLSRILTARSIDGGRTVTRAVELQSADAQGLRGGPALALD